jgi:hypothetical protein
MDNIPDNLTDKEIEAIAATVNEYLKLQTVEQEYEDDISFWSVNKKTDTKQEIKNDTL